MTPLTLRMMTQTKAVLTGLPHPPAVPEKLERQGGTKAPDKLTPIPIYYFLALLSHMYWAAPMEALNPPPLNVLKVMTVLRARCLVRSPP